MNEILKKRIEEAAVEHQSKQPYCDDRKVRGMFVGYRKGFIEGAEYALSHQWISVEEALPEYGELVFVKHMPIASVYDYQINTSLSYREKSTIGDRWIINGMSWLVNKKNKEDNTVLAWMPIPKFELNKPE